VGANLKILPLVLLLLLPLSGVAEPSRYQQSIQQMKEQPRGPFSRIRWFCHDGTVLPPKAYACRPHGGGVQHGQWSEQTLALREQGYLVANLLAGIRPDEALADPDFDNVYGQRLVERFLVGVDDGWIFRKALFYRGAIQEEDERAGGRALLLAMLSDPAWRGPHFLATRTGVKLLPHGHDSASAGRVRRQSASLSEDDPPFMPVRIKIHGAPDATDAQRVREYMAGVTDPDLRSRYEELAGEIDRIYQAQPLSLALSARAGDKALSATLRQAFAGAAAGWEGADSPTRMALSGSLLAAVRNAVQLASDPQQGLALLDFSLRLESEHFRAAAEVRAQLPDMNRRQILQSMAAAGDAAFGVGLLNRRLLDALRAEVDGLLATDISIADYQRGLAYLNRAPGWGLQALRRYFYQPMMTLVEVEPKALLFIQDQLRGSPLMHYSQALNLLVRDAGTLAGIRHKLFGEEVGAGFTALNPGLARGVLHAGKIAEHAEALREDGIYVLPETVAELPPVAGILTAGEGNPLSHVQLLARNLGIPNVTVAPAQLQKLSQHDGRVIVLAVSPGGLVEISADDPGWDAVFAESGGSNGVHIAPDLEKLDLGLRRIVDIDELSASDSGRTVGPKAAKLAELRKHYPEAVSRGLAIPFGVFKSVVLDQPHPQGGTLFEWMQRRYRALAEVPDNSPKQRESTEQFRAELYRRILQTPLSDAFKRDLQQALGKAFGSGSVGLFVRSDTNVEDLAGFTGAGLNLTLPNVVGIDGLLESITRVWASPFTARAFSWRQSHMSEPEHVYTSILLLESVGSDKSGVLVTADIDSGARNVLSVAVNEGLGGAVDGQAAESLRIPLPSGPVRVLATATAPSMRLLSPGGGIVEVPSSGTDEVLSPADIEQLRLFAQSLPERFPPITDDDGNVAPADVEFGFLDGRLRLFQLRPFLDNASVARNSYLQQMDSRSNGDLDQLVDMQGRPVQ
jgi:Pyruvate phosphate dikinase, AMP/ATP-binding domain/PEP-utilising enzyme, mobile domain